MLDQFPFRIRGFHSDNGSEFINYPVSQLSQKLLEEQTKSRPRHSNDNGLVETKNGSVIRKNIGSGHIASEHADASTSSSAITSILVSTSTELWSDNSNASDPTSALGVTAYHQASIRPRDSSVSPN